MTEHQKEVLKRIAYPVAIFSVVLLVIWYLWKNGLSIFSSTVPNTSQSGVPVYNNGVGGAPPATAQNPNILNFYPQSGVTPEGGSDETAIPGPGSTDRLTYNTPPALPNGLPGPRVYMPPVARGDCCDPCAGTRNTDSRNTTLSVQSLPIDYGDWMTQTSNGLPNILRAG